MTDTKLSYETLAENADAEKQEKEQRERNEEIYKKFKPYKDLYSLDIWKEVADLMKDDAFQNLHHTEDGIWYHRSWGIKMFINCIKERAEAYDQACKELSK